MLCCVASSLESLSARIVSLKDAEELMMGYRFEPSAGIDNVACRDVANVLGGVAVLNCAHEWTFTEIACLMFT